MCSNTGTPNNHHFLFGTNRKVVVLGVPILKHFRVHNLFPFVEMTNKRAMMALGHSPEYQWNQIISKSVHWFSRRSRLKLFSIYSPGGHFVQHSRTVLAIFVDSHLRNIPVLISKSMHWLRRRSHLKVFLFLALAANLVNGAE